MIAKALWSQKDSGLDGSQQQLYHDDIHRPQVAELRVHHKYLRCAITLFSFLFKLDFCPLFDLGTE